MAVADSALTYASLASTNWRRFVMKTAFAAAVLAGVAGIASAQSLDVVASPNSILPGGSYDVQVFANSDGSIAAGANGIAFAGFGLTVSVDNGSIGLAGGDTSAINTALLFGATVDDNGDGSFTLVGGQTANLFGLLNPGINQEDPILLFSFTVSGAAEGTSTVSVGQADGRDFAIAWYPDSQAGASETFITSGSATVDVVPTPAAAGLLGLGGLVAARRRR
ncbi:MAG: hypothetical protein AAF995_07305 [Planctomycetota bacterium]